VPVTMCFRLQLKCRYASHFQSPYCSPLILVKGRSVKSRRFSQAELKSMDSLRKLKRDSPECVIPGAMVKAWRYCSMDVSTGILVWDDEELLGEEDYVRK
jgi:hypothetical protein